MEECALKYVQCVFCCSLIKISFEWIDYLKFILVKNELKVKWFLFLDTFFVKVSWIKKIGCKN